MSLLRGHGEGSRLDQLNSPCALCTDPNGDLFIADYGNDRSVERFDRRGIEPFELFKSEFGQNSWNPKKTTKSHSIEVAFDPLDKKGPQENREKGNTLL